ncbi:hypothetical protein HPB49_013762 [Dermacentor silvarum]|uniref:Uncharacterized protein n=1 Tax=Dermacentor silvarum TaxID=543639 RepID=A0ACB8CFJ2_DERSI|nr:hypothetical protein HPB49_013762 [Dermacentor silvarum]
MRVHCFTVSKKLRGPGSTTRAALIPSDSENAHAPWIARSCSCAPTHRDGASLARRARLYETIRGVRDYTANQEKHLRGASQRASQILRRKLRLMQPHRWARRMFEYIHRNGVRTRWTKRLQQLSKKYGFFASPVQEETERKWAKAVETLVRQTEVDTWRQDMEGKSTLKLYREHKQEIRMEPLYDNSVASSLLFEARAGALRTLVYRRRYDDNVGSVMCKVCNADQETIEHLVLHCASLTPAPIDGTTLPLALGFSPRVPSGGGGGHQVNQVATTKSRLREWWAIVRAH